ncbi:hypothetical protein ASPBRDRAFT_415726 [Aspergillus brasiliensis CBS 101740]|uniref:Uncharacterized protein n=1 Tax=Aspergillus brasiliensis (strain CBS 101740 / IMI 381727 / IBT 21946) TaxID=767769 RepID=A0A1L9UY92_ASPBC|nr:hypothetical protein ASPBRDRAFT_415726 [Aspergillus brasiliensis CBS 101740]
MSVSARNMATAPCWPKLPLEPVCRSVCMYMCVCFLCMKLWLPLAVCPTWRSLGEIVWSDHPDVSNIATQKQPLPRGLATRAHRLNQALLPDAVSTVPATVARLSHTDASQNPG